jgi:hypothetical protein
MLARIQRIDDQLMGIGNKLGVKVLPDESDYE